MPTIPDSSPIAYIYALTEPDTGLIRYIGKTSNPRVRYRNHLIPRELSVKSHKTHWLRGLLSQGKKPGLLILQCIPESEWEDSERGWIAQFKESGYDLVNTALGGWDGPRPYLTGRKHGPVSDETRQKLRAAFLGRKNGPCSEETKRKISIANAGRKPSAEAIAKSVLFRAGVPSWNKGIPMRPESKDKMSIDWALTDPEGNEYQIRNLKEFCKNHGLDTPLMHHVATGKRKTHRGWTCRRLSERTDA
jgi:hypothetical protein